MRKRYFRAMRFRLECGHRAVEHTCWWRLDARRASCLVGGYVRRGVWCDKCKAHCQLVEYLGTCRGAEAFADHNSADMKGGE